MSRSADRRIGSALSGATAPGLRRKNDAPATGTAYWPCRRWRAEGGFSLIEIIVAIGIISVAVIVLVTALLDSVNASVVHQQTAVGDTVLRNYVEAIEAAVQQNCSATPAGGSNGTYGSAPALASFVAPKDTAGDPYQTKAVPVGSSPAFGTCPAATVVAQLAVSVMPPADQPQPATGKAPALTIGLVDP